jgi:N-acetylmuramoyl-L-alanine amidase
MKKAITVLLAALLLMMLAACGTSSSTVNSIKLENGLRSLRIAVDPGHGGIDNGAVGTDTGVFEAALNLEISQLIAKQFMLSGADVLMTRKSAEVDYTGDGNTQKRKDMNSRSKVVQAQNPQVLVSIHMNKYPDRKVSGAQVFFEKGSVEGEKLATYIQESLNSGMDAAKKRTAKPGDYFMLKVTSSPSVIVECGFLSNHDDEKKLLDPDYRAKLADCIYKGICTYLGIK